MLSMLAGWPWLFPRFLALVRKLFGAPDVFFGGSGEVAVVSAASMLRLMVSLLDR
jgi:hypothetical protein